MPYILTAKRPCCDDCEPPRMSVSRRAVATLKGREIWNALYGVEISNREHMVELIAALPESGGTVGYLSDGTVIEVEQTTWGDLYAESDVERGGEQQIIDAFNAKQERV